MFKYTKYINNKTENGRVEVSFIPNPPVSKFALSKGPCDKLHNLTKKVALYNMKIIVRHSTG